MKQNSPTTHGGFHNDDSTLFLPNFCDVHTVFFGVVLTELLAFVLTLAPLSKNGFNWFYITSNFVSDLALFSLFIQWVNLVSMAILCSLRRWFLQLYSDATISLLSYFIILLITWLASELAWRLDEIMLSTSPAFTVTHHLFLLKITSGSMIITSIILLTLYYRQLLQKNTVILGYLTVFIATVILTELASLFLSPISLRSYALQHHLFLLRNLGISAIIAAITLRYFYVQYHWRLATTSNVHARIQALQARIRPHFLFNSMNTIASLIHFHSDKAEQAVEDLSALFRASLSDAKKWSTFHEEIALCQSYLRIETLRLEERLRVVWNIETIPEDALLPRFSIQPLIENAIYHGIQPIPEGGRIIITGLFDEHTIKIEIENPYIDSTISSHRGNRLAQQNIRERLQAYYGSQAKLTILKNNRYCVTLHFPYRKNL